MSRLNVVFLIGALALAADGIAAPNDPAHAPTTGSSVLDNVTLSSGRLVFGSEEDFTRVLAYLSERDGGAEPRDGDALDAFEARFASYRSLRARIEEEEQAGRDSLADEFPDDVFNTLLNGKRQVQIGATVWKLASANRFVPVSPSTTSGGFLPSLVTGSGTQTKVAKPPTKSVRPVQGAPQPGDDCEGSFGYLVHEYDSVSQKYKVAMLNNSTYDAPPVTFQWSVFPSDDPNQGAALVTSTDVSPMFDLSPGQYDILLEASNPAGSEDDRGDCDEVMQTITLEPCGADFSYHATPGGLTVTFKDLSAGGNVREWSIADASSNVIASAETSNLVHTFQKKGSYTVTLTTNGGCSKTKTLAVSDECAPDFEVSYDCKSPTKVHFTNTSTGGTGPISYAWDFGDAGTSTASDPDHGYKSESKYTVKLDMTDGTGGSCGHVEKNITVKGCLDKAKFTVGPICIDGRVTFTADNASKDEILGWDFPGGDPGFAGNFLSFYGKTDKPWVFYHQAGQYDVTLHVKTADGCTCEQTNRVTVPEVKCCDFRFSRNVYKQTFSGKSSKTYKVKIVLAQTNVPFVHRVVAKTKLRVKIGLFWKRATADGISASFNGPVYKDKGTWLDSHWDHTQCCCEVPETVQASSGTVPNKWRARALASVNGSFRTRLGTLTSSHSVTVDGVTVGTTAIPLSLSLGQKCSRN